MRATGSVLHTFSAPNGPQGIVLSPDGKTLYVAAIQTNEILRLDAQTGAILGPSFTAGTMLWPTGLALSADGKTLYAAGELSNRVTKLDAATGAYLGSDIIGDSPVSLAISSDGGTLFAAGYSTSSVFSLDAASGTRDDIRIRSTLESPTRRGLCRYGRAGTCFRLLALHGRPRRCGHRPAVFKAESDRNAMNWCSLGKPRVRWARSPVPGGPSSIGRKLAEFVERSIGMVDGGQGRAYRGSRPRGRSDTPCSSRDPPCGDLRGMGNDGPAERL